MRVILVALLLVASSVAQIRVSGGGSIRGGRTIGVGGVGQGGGGEGGGGTFASCIASDPASLGWQKLTGCSTNLAAAGEYYIDTDLHAGDSCFSPNNLNDVVIHLQGKSIYYGENSTEFDFTDKAVTRSGSSASDVVPTGKGIWSSISSVTRIGNAPGASDYTQGVDFTFCTDTSYSTGHNCGDARAIVWIGANKPAVGATYYVTGKSKEAATAFFAAGLSVNTTGLTTVPVAGGGNRSGLKCGKLVAHANAPHWSSGMIGARTDMILEDIEWETSNPNAFNQHVWLNEGQTGGEIRRVKATSASRWVLSRDNNHGAIFRMYGTGVAGNGTIVENSSILDGVHVGFDVRNQNSIVRNNYIRTRSTKYTNSFAIGAYSSVEVYGNTIDNWLSSDLSVGSRGIYLVGNGAWAHNNTVSCHGHNTNLEYSGCEFSGTDNPTGGVYCIQTEGSNSSHSDNNDVVAVADLCGGRARRFSSVGALATPATAYFNNEVYRAFKTSAAAPGAAVGLSATTLYGDTTNAIGAVGVDSRIEADTYNVEWLHRGNATFKRLVLVKGTEDAKYTCGNPANAGVGICSHPDPNYHTFRFQGYGDAQTVTCVDCEARNGASLTDVSGFIENSASNWYKHYDLWIKWTRTVHVDDGTHSISGANVYMTDATGATWIGITDALGNAKLELPQWRIFNNTTTAVNQENRNPYSLSISKSGCATLNASGISVTATSTDNRALNCSTLTLASVAISPASATVFVSDYEDFSATCTWSDGSTSNCTSSMNWSVGVGFSLSTVGGYKRATNNGCSNGSRQLTAQNGAVGNTISIACNNL
jgi:hypothetical protein